MRKLSGLPCAASVSSFGFYICTKGFKAWTVLNFCHSALNMMDIIKKNGDHIDTKKLGEMLGCKIVEISALKGDGIEAAAKQAVALAQAKVPAVAKHRFSDAVESALHNISDILQDKIDEKNLRWFSVKVFERDKEIMAGLSLSTSELAHIESIWFNMANIVVSAIVLILVIAAGRSIYKDHKKGVCSSCGCGCSSCKSCHHHMEENKQN